MAIKVLRVDKDFVKIGLSKSGIARAVVWPGMGAKYGGMNYFVMKPGDENIPHIHEKSEDTFYVIKGKGVVIDVDANIEVKKGVARAVVWPGMGAKYGSMHYFVMKPGEENLSHVHEKSEDIFYIIQGKGVVIDLDKNIEYPLEEGCVVYVEPGTRHQVKSYGPKDLMTIGGPRPFDLKLYKGLKTKQ